MHLSFSPVQTGACSFCEGKKLKETFKKYYCMYPSLYTRLWDIWTRLLSKWFLRFPPPFSRKERKIRNTSTGAYIYISVTHEDFGVIVFDRPGRITNAASITRCYLCLSTSARIFNTFLSPSKKYVCLYFTIYNT